MLGFVYNTVVDKVQNVTDLYCRPARPRINLVELFSHTKCCVSIHNNLVGTSRVEYVPVVPQVFGLFCHCFGIVINYGDNDATEACFPLWCFYCLDETPELRRTLASTNETQSVS